MPNSTTGVQPLERPLHVLLASENELMHAQVTSMFCDAQLPDSSNVVQNLPAAGEALAASS